MGEDESTKQNDREEPIRSFLGRRRLDFLLPLLLCLHIAVLFVWNTFQEMELINLNKEIKAFRIKQEKETGFVYGLKSGISPISLLHELKIPPNGKK